MPITEQISLLAVEAFIYGHPVVDNHHLINLYALDKSSRDDYVSRSAGALLGIYGHVAEEYLGNGYQTDANGKPFDGNHKYQIRFEADAFPPVGAFRSITAYNARKFLIENPIHRYVINSPMRSS